MLKVKIICKFWHSGRPVFCLRKKRRKGLPPTQKKFFLKQKQKNTPKTGSGWKLQSIPNVNKTHDRTAEYESRTRNERRKSNCKTCSPKTNVSACETLGDAVSESEACHESPAEREARGGEGRRGQTDWGGRRWAQKPREQRRRTGDTTWEDSSWWR